MGPNSHHVGENNLENLKLSCVAKNKSGNFNMLQIEFWFEKHPAKGEMVNFGRKNADRADYRRLKMIRFIHVTRNEFLAMDNVSPIHRTDG